MIPEGIVSDAIPGGKGRNDILGGSDWSSIISFGSPDLYKYGCLRRLVMEKRGLETDFGRVMSKPAIRGKILEKIVAEFWRVESGCRFVRTRPRAKELWSGQPLPEWWGGHPDRIFVIPPDKKLKLLECKTMGRSVWFDYRENGLNDGYKLQPQHYMGITGIEESILAVLWADGIDFFAEPIVRDEETLRLMLEWGNWFWQDVMSSEVLPARQPLTKERCGECPYRRKCLGKGYYEEHVLHEYAFDDDDALYKLLKEHREAQKAESASKKVKEAAAEAVKDYLAEHYADQDPEKVHCREIDVTYGKALASSFKKEDAMAESEEAAELIRRHTKVSPRRSLKTTQTKKSEERWERIQNPEPGDD